MHSYLVIGAHISVPIMKKIHLDPDKAIVPSSQERNVHRQHAVTHCICYIWLGCMNSTGTLKMCDPVQFAERTNWTLQIPNALGKSISPIISRFFCNILKHAKLSPFLMSVYLSFRGHVTYAIFFLVSTVTPALSLISVNSLDETVLL